LELQKCSFCVLFAYRIATISLVKKIAIDNSNFMVPLFF